MITLSEPTLKIYLGPNTSPFAAQDGDFYTARQLEERLQRERRTNIGLRIEANPDGHGFLVAGRGELHLSVLIENLRREGYEMEVGKPQVIFKEIDGKKMEPFEEATIEVDQEYMGTVMEEMGKRRGTMINSHTNHANVVRMEYKVASKNILGFRSVLLNKTRGTATMNTRFLGYEPLTPGLEKLRNGAIVALERGMATAYTLESVEQRGQTFIGPGVDVYEGMIIGLNNRQEDIDMNVTKVKHLTNHRSANADILTTLKTPITMSLEQALDFLENDELLEATPKNLRLRKRYLNRLERVRAQRSE